MLEKSREESKLLPNTRLAGGTTCTSHTVAASRQNLPQFLIFGFVFCQSFPQVFDLVILLGKNLFHVSISCCLLEFLL